MIPFALIHLEALIEIAQQGSFQAAADRLGVAQPTISMRVRDLESALGGPLFDRSGHRAMLTERGREALRYARQMVGLARELHGVSATEEAAGVVRIGAADTFALQQLPGLLAELERRYPRLRVDLTIDHSVRLSRILRREGIDLAFLTMPEQTPEERERLAALGNAAMRLLAQAAPDLTAVEQLADQVRSLAQSSDPQVADTAARLELRLLGAILAGRAALLRQLAQELQRAAQWLPPDQPERN